MQTPQVTLPSPSTNTSTDTGENASLTTNPADWSREELAQLIHAWEGTLDNNAAHAERRPNEAPRHFNQRILQKFIALTGNNNRNTRMERCIVAKIYVLITRITSSPSSAK